MTWRAAARGFVLDAVEALLVATLPPRCGVCAEPLATRPRYRVCDRCWVAVAPNDGPRCGSCDLPGDADLCSACAASPPPFVSLVAPFVYGGTVADLVGAVKFHGREDLVAGLARMLLDDTRVHAAFRDARYVVPVPLGWRRRWRRGFNQSAALARALAAASGTPVVHALRRRRDTRPQSELPIEARRANVAGAFGPRRRVEGICVLVDDVVTSAETVRQASAALRDAGAEEVRVVAVARTALED